ncbi:MAG: hypothetical protein M3299_06945 [Thermoproteota archaeon]|nr:hypothetical protein [Thermoproteota archaeon]
MHNGVDKENFAGSCSTVLAWKEFSEGINVIPRSQDTIGRKSIPFIFELQDE